MTNTDNKSVSFVQIVTTLEYTNHMYNSQIFILILKLRNFKFISSTQLWKSILNSLSMIMKLQIIWHLFTYITCEHVNTHGGWKHVIYLSVLDSELIHYHL